MNWLSGIGRRKKGESSGPADPSFPIKIKFMKLIALGVILAFIQSITMAQAPSSIAGRTIQLNITSGTYPFASYGSYQVLPSATDNWYTVVPLSGGVDPSVGTYSYSVTGLNEAKLTVSDTLTGTSTVVCSFMTSSSGTYTITNPLVPGSKQTGSFAVFSGPSPETLTGYIFNVTVTSGAPPFASSGSFRFIPTSSSSYRIEGGVGVSNSNGTYAYSKASPTTGILAIQDSISGSSTSHQLSFDTAASGTIVLRQTGGWGYQTAVFTMESMQPPVILVHPESSIVALGSGTTFTINAAGAEPLRYQWLKNDVFLFGATQATFTIPNVQLSDQGEYKVLISNDVGSVVSHSANLSIILPPFIIVNLTNVTIQTGSNAVLRVEATGTPPLTYQWLKDGMVIPDATDASLALSNIQMRQSGEYIVNISNPAGTVTSDTSTIKVWKAASTSPRIVIVSRNGTNTILRIEQMQEGSMYRLRCSPDLDTWTTIEVRIAGGIQYEVTHPNAGKALFYRVVSP